MSGARCLSDAQRLLRLEGSLNRMLFCMASACAVVLAPTTDAKPIAFADGTTVVAEYGAGTMTEVQVFNAPRHF